MSAEDTTRFKQILKKHDYSCTAARLKTFQLLLSPEPQSMAQLIARSQGSVDRVSLYRNIELFEKLGIANRIHSGWKYKIELSDDFVAHHHHLTCLGCGKMIDIEDEAHIDDFIHRIADQHGFTVRRHQFEIDGYCDKCAVL